MSLAGRRLTHGPAERSGGHPGDRYGDGVPNLSALTEDWRSTRKKAARRGTREVQRRAEWLRERCEAVEERRMLAQVRGAHDVCWPPGAEHQPLVTVRIATYDRGPVVAERAIASALEQTYPHIEILVVGDHCTPETEAAVRSVDDPRIRFVNLPTRGVYPDGAAERRKVAGAHPMNAARYLARGQWIAPCDDDDTMTPDHVEALLARALEGRFEMVFSKAHHEETPGRWREVGSLPLRKGEISHGTTLYSSGLRFLRHSSTCWKLPEPSDWNLWKRMEQIGVRIGFLDQVTYTLNLPAREREQLALRARSDGP